ncbi:ribosomal protein S18-alanine N-acetyltransferase [Shewanella sp. AS1]|uniref:ribosomal protein S18-alanine N-acetyltransferase n=1 Tax=Shewanella sp. AS1 TaxID=2907626 RepID=UPI001F4740CE|nr:ribosomal protein S18-alanine N-acetyltransferase [Shewanella sp. AS1]MCE9679007.1 ribosomal protein S18-alanine N-acetyltransferase [Shewanella sp. AS1]
MQLKLLSIDEAAQIHQIAQLCHQFPMSFTNIESCFGRFYKVFGYYQDDALVGFAVLHRVFEDATLMDICVHPEHQGRGIAQQLIKVLVDTAATEGAERIMLEVRVSSQRAIALYRYFGFEQVGLRKDYYPLIDGKEDALLMERHL